MSTQQISKVFNGNHLLAVKGSATDRPYGKLMGNSGTLAKEPCLDKVEEAPSWQDKIIEAHLNFVVLPSEILRKRAMQQTRSKNTLYEKTKSLHYLNASFSANGFRTIYAGRTIQASN